MGLTRWIAAGLGLLLWLSCTTAVQAEAVAAPGDRCLLAVQHEQYEEAITSCSQAIEHAADSADYRLSRGLAYYRVGQFTQAQADATQVLAAHPEDYRAYYNRGLVQVALHAFGDAIADFDQAVALTPEPTALADIYDDRGLAKLMAAQPEAALHDFDRALAIDPDDTRALFNHGCACHQLGQLDAALSDLDQLLALEPKQARSYLKRGVLRQCWAIALAVWPTSGRLPTAPRPRDRSICTTISSPCSTSGKLPASPGDSIHSSFHHYPLLVRGDSTVGELPAGNMLYPAAAASAD